MSIAVASGKKEIWLIDDDRLDVMTVKRAFLKQKVEIPLQVYTSAVEALLRIENGNSGDLPDLILLDLNMPGIDGISFLRKIKANDQLKNIPVFILTTSSNPDDKKVCYELEVKGYYTKPVDFFELIPVVLGLMRDNSSHN